MPRQPKDFLDPENIYALDSKEEIQEFLESYSIGGFDSYDESRYEDFDSDNYGYDDYSY